MSSAVANTPPPPSSSSSTLVPGAVASPSSSWQTLVRQRLEERDERERAFDEMIESYQRLARYAKQQRDRNTSLLAAAGAVKSVPSASSSSSTAASTKSSTAPSTTRSPSPKASTATTAATSSADAAVKQAYIVSLEAQLQTMRDELATLYKTQSQNAQRLLVLNEQMRSRDDKDRDAGQDVRRTAEELTRTRRKEEDLRSVVGEKDKMIQLLQDELSALSLELSQVEKRNADLKRDNASLLQRWLDRMNEEADKMNEGNQFLEEVDRRRGSGTAVDEDALREATGAKP